ncbi:HIT family protein [Aquisalibacillus elongatus]|uniref:Histidine triad (HIT) family protein n=1 Tax=Aquisalibacillus elongatus TaxID=485577 RepID=A0A3N5C9J6_9BACI|nr:HIT family protein [Aquisalibacillus elongatus]RPF53321.1 histidine triad (HIT) family protein [Aquisalibacillus elongatus]
MVGFKRRLCIFCYTELEQDQEIIMSNDLCVFLQLTQFQVSGVTLEGAGVIVPKQHRETVFDLREDEWRATYELLQRVKAHLDKSYQPDGYNIGWNSGEVGGQSIHHAHLHILPRYQDETMANKGIRYFIKSDENRRLG